MPVGEPLQRGGLSRRKFLALVGASAVYGAAALSCRAARETGQPIEETPSPSPTPQPTATSRPSPIPPGIRVGLARQDKVAQMVRTAVELAGGFGSLSGATILIKPNVNSGDPHPASTNPAVVGAVVEMVMQERPKRVIVADHSNPGTGKTLDNMQRVGIYQAASQAGAEVVGLEAVEWIRVAPQGASSWPEGFRVPKLLEEIDYLITLPVVKTHSIASYSMSLKNTVGLIHPSSRSILHSQREPTFGAMIAEINLARPADFVVMDATRAFLSGGPASGKVAEPGIILASRDLLAADAAGLALLKHLGATPAVQDRHIWDQPQMARGRELGLGVTSFQDFSLSAHGVAEVEAIRGFLGRSSEGYQRREGEVIA